MIKPIIVLLGLLAAVWIFLHRCSRASDNLRRGRPEVTFGRWGERFKGFLLYGLAQVRLFKFRLSGLAHFLLFWGFFFLLFTILEALLRGLTAGNGAVLHLPVISTFGPLALVQDILTIAVLLAAGYGFYQRLLVKPTRYMGSHQEQAIKILALVTGIMVTLLIMNAASITLGEDVLARWRPFSSILAVLVAGVSPFLLWFIREAAYFLHLGLVLYFLTDLPNGKHFHIITSIPAKLLRNLEPPGRLAAGLELPDAYGTGEFAQFTQRQLLDFYTCTECGRCQDACPAYAAGQPLSPKQLIMDLRAGLEAYGEAMRQGRTTLPESLIGVVVKRETLWACYTCFACEDACPMFIEHVRPIVDMRRRMVDSGEVRGTLKRALDSLERYGNSFMQTPDTRAIWAEHHEPGIKDARKEAVEYLWLVGDYASFDPELNRISKLTAQVLQRLGVDFGILYEAECNSGNDARRVGEEGLYELLVERNRKNFDQSQFKAILTTDPHTYNTLKNEYPPEALNGRPVLHYSQFLEQLLADGRLVFKNKVNYRVTYHDPCYLGRYNGVYDAPRRVLEAAGCHLVEMPANREGGFCCGAGGGRIWMEEEGGGERPAEIRLRQAAELEDVGVFVTACPKDTAMFRDALETVEMETRMVVKDLIEIVDEAM